MKKQTKWTLDPSHSEITFRVKHLMIANVKGNFGKFDISLQSAGDDFNTAKTLVTIDASSINTNNPDRDNHLKSADFFDVEQFGEIIFESTSFKVFDEENARLTGNLTIRGVTREVALEVEIGGVTRDPWGNEKAGFSLSGKISRKEFGLTWNVLLESGGVMVSDDVRIAAELQFVKQAEAVSEAVPA